MLVLLVHDNIQPTLIIFTTSAKCDCNHIFGKAQLLTFGLVKNSFGFTFNFMNETMGRLTLDEQVIDKSSTLPSAHLPDSPQPKSQENVLRNL